MSSLVLLSSAHMYAFLLKWEWNVGAYYKCLTLLEIATQISKVASPFPIPNSSAWGFQLVHRLHLWYCQLFWLQPFWWASLPCFESKGKVCSPSPSGIMSAGGFVQLPFIKLQKISSMSVSLRVFIMNWCGIFIKHLFCINSYTHVGFSF